MAEDTPRTFIVGDKVHFTFTKRSGRSIEFKTRDATILAVSGDIATVKYRNGRKTRVHVSRLRHEREKTEITDMMMSRAKQ